MKQKNRHDKRAIERLNEAWEAGFQDILEQLMRGYERLTGKKRAPVPVPQRRRPRDNEHEEQR